MCLPPWNNRRNNIQMRIPGERGNVLTGRLRPLCNPLPLKYLPFYAPIPWAEPPVQAIVGGPPPPFPGKFILYIFSVDFKKSFLHGKKKR